MLAHCLLEIPFCHLGDGHHLTGFPPACLFLPAPELVGEPKLGPADDEPPPPACLRGALAPTAMTKFQQCINLGANNGRFGPGGDSGIFVMGRCE